MAKGRSTTSNVDLLLGYMHGLLVPSVSGARTASHKAINMPTAVVYPYPIFTRYRAHRFALTIHTWFCLYLYFQTADAFSVYYFHSNFLKAATRAKYTCRTKRTVDLTSVANSCFIRLVLLKLPTVLMLLWLYLLIYRSGDVHPNPGPTSPISDDSSIRSSSDSSFLGIKSNHLSFVHYNVQSVLPKLDIISSELSEIDILAFSETWLSSTTPIQMLEIPTYKQPERKERTLNNYGGVMIYIKENIFHSRRKDLEIIGIENIWVEIRSHNKQLLFGIFYRPPNVNIHYDSLVEESLGLAIDTGIDNIIVVGDFNKNVLNDKTAKFIESICSQFNFQQCVNEPTHFTETSSSLLDLILVRNPEQLVYCNVGEPIFAQNTRYHCPTYGYLTFSKHKHHSFKRRVWYFNRGDYEKLREMTADTNWENLKQTDIDEYANNITSRILSLAEECIPSRLVTIRPTDPTWLTSNLKAKIRKRKRLYRKARFSNNPDTWLRFRTLRNEIITLIRSSKSKQLDQLANKLKSNSYNSQNWWSIMKTFISPNKRNSIPPLLYHDRIMLNDVDKANSLNNFFAEQANLLNNEKDVPNIDTHATSNPLTDIHFTPEEVSSVLSCLSLGKASGPDDINNRILRELHHELSHPLCSLFNYSIQCGKVPSIWKQANVTPIFKKGDSSDVSNYRPISLLSCLSKVFERLVFKYLFNHFRDNSILSPFQSGFIPKDSTTNQLVYLYDTFCEALDRGKEVRVVFFDISKAFDKVWHKGLIAKLASSGVQGSLLKWFDHYLSDRKQRVVLPGCHSEWKPVLSGVPQGSILGPILFLLYINDIVTEVTANIRLFADDTTLFLTVDNPNDAAVQLNRDIDAISLWADKWLVNFNPSKTKTMLISRKQKQTTHPPISMKNQSITNVSTHKHLGLILSSDCTWHTQIDSITKKAWIRINIMRRFKYCLDRKSLEIMYKSFIRPLLEYGDVVWSNITNNEKHEIEKIQLEAARITLGATKLISLHHIYKETGWEPLTTRRTNHCMTQFYKMYHKTCPAYLSSLIPTRTDHAYNLRNANDIKPVRCKSKLYSDSFLPATIRNWNNTDLSIRNSPSLGIFKKALGPRSPNVPPYYFRGRRRLQALHLQLRTGCSPLHYDLYRKNIIESPRCSCGDTESAFHYFLKCPLYVDQRINLVSQISSFCNPSLHIILSGNPSLDLLSNETIVDAVHNYIKHTKRFQNT